MRKECFEVVVVGGGMVVKADMLNVLVVDDMIDIVDEQTRGGMQLQYRSPVAEWGSSVNSGSGGSSRGECGSAAETGAGSRSGVWSHVLRKSLVRVGVHLDYLHQKLRSTRAR